VASFCLSTVWSVATRRPNCKFEWDRNASHHGPSTLALGLFTEILWQLLEYWPAIRQAFLKGPAQTTSEVRRRHAVHVLIGPSVLRAASERTCCAKVPCALALLGCPSTGGQRTESLRQSATCHRQVGALSFGSPRSVRAVGPRRGQHPAVVAGATTAWHLTQGWLKWHEQSAHVQHHKQGVASMAARPNPLSRSRAFKALHAETGPTVGSTRTLTVGIASDTPYGRRLTWR